MNHFPIPKEHGAYVVLIAAWLLGIVYSHCVDVPGFVLSLVFPLSLFFLQEPIRRIIRRKPKEKVGFDPLSLFLAVIAIASGAILALHSPDILYLSLPLTLIVLLYFYFVRKRSPAMILSLIGFCGLALIAPLTILASNCRITIGHLAAVWLFAILFFSGSLLCVNIRLSGGRGVTIATIYHIFAFSAMILLSYSHNLPYSTIAVIGISSVRLLVIIIYRNRYIKLKIKYIGIQESVVAGLGVIISALPF